MGKNKGTYFYVKVYGKHSDLDLLLFTKAHSREIRASFMHVMLLQFPPAFCSPSENLLYKSYSSLVSR